jgi:hypothetical protein
MGEEWVRNRCTLQQFYFCTLYTVDDIYADLYVQNLTMVVMYVPFFSLKLRFSRENWLATLDTLVTADSIGSDASLLRVAYDIYGPWWTVPN